MQSDTAAYVGHVLNTIAEEEVADDENIMTSPLDGDGTDSSECELTVTVKLPLKRATAEAMAAVEASVSSPVDFWQQINDDPAEASTPPSDSDDGCSGDENPSGAACLPKNPPQKPSGAACLSDNDDEDDDDDDDDDDENDDDEDENENDDVEEDDDSGITTTSSVAEIPSRLTSDREVAIGGGGGGRNSKKYQRTCTHSRLFDFLRRDDDDDDDDEDDGADSCSNVTDGGNKLRTQPSSCTSGYSSAATTPSTPSAAGRSRTYESDSARTEYDSYYKSWEYACPYFGYDILPSKAFKTICKPPTTTAATTTKFKCPKIPAGEHGS